MKPGKEIDTEQKCDYGCGRNGRYQFANGKISCEPFSRNCPHLRMKYLASAAKAGAAAKEIDPELGVSPAQVRYQKASQTKKSTFIDGRSMWEIACERSVAGRTKLNEHGETPMQIGARKAVQTRKPYQKEITEKTRKSLLSIASDGRTKAQVATEKAIETKSRRLSNGQSVASEAATRAAQTRKNTILPNGETLQEHAIRKFRSTIHSVVEDGKTIAQIRSDKSIVTRAKRGTNNSGLKVQYHHSGVRYQGSYERAYLDELCDRNGIEWVSENVTRGPTIRYINLTTMTSHFYFADFEHDGLIVEIKSSAYWDRKNDTSWLAKGYCKLRAANSLKPVILVLDGVSLDWATYENVVRERLALLYPHIDFTQETILQFP